MYQITLGYDNVGRIAQKIETVAGTAHTFDYTYDVDGQLFEVRKDGLLVEQYGYDNNANRTNTLTATATYDDQDRLIQQSGVNYTFDADGYLVQRGTDTFENSARGELLSATVSGQTVTYQCDGIGRRIGKTDAAGATQYLYGDPANPFQVTASRDAAGILSTYFYDTAGNLYAFERGGVRYYVATDQLGTPKVVTDNAGNVVKQVEYDAWGVKISDTNPSFDLPVGFAGGITDAATGLVRFGFRDYEPGSGRWAARDPILFRGGQGNLFLYTGNDPVNFADRAGLWSLAFNAGFHLPPLPGYASAGLNVGSEKVHPFGPDKHWEGKGITPEAVVGSMADVGISAGISDLSNTGGKCAGDTINIGFGRYAGFQITLGKNSTWSDPTTWVDGVTVGLGFGVSLPFSYTIPLNQ